MKYCRECKSVVSTPIMLTGGFRQVASMDRALTKKELDVIGLGRPLCGMPDACNKVSGLLVSDMVSGLLVTR
jgi:2,4-dienoyl-CoA reductase-like NADH-dependent reductase (Old Yellow Enzyme family)